MASFVAILDPDAQRRERFLTRAQDDLAPVPKLDHGSAACGDFALRWAASPSAPVSIDEDRTGLTVLWGDAFLGDAPRRAGATDMTEAWAGPQTAPVAAGFHACVHYRWGAGGRLVAGGDVLGLFPLYHWSGGDGCVVVTSSARLVRHHPAYSERPSLEGIAGILLTGGLVDGRSVWEDVRRLAPGHLLVAAPDTATRELCQYEAPRGPGGARGEGVDELAERVDAAIRGAVRRHAPVGRRLTLLLSGGRDSRLLAGYLRDEGRDVDALTLGRPDDFEVVHSEAVRRHLGMPRRVEEVPFAAYRRLARTHIDAEQLHASLAGLHNWGVGELLDHERARVVVGHGLESAAGRLGARWAGLDAPVARIRETMWRFLGVRAVPLGRWKSMIRAGPLSDAAATVVESVDRRSTSCGSFDGAVRDHLIDRWFRAHPGAVPWRLSFRAWPIVPILDPVVLEAGAAASRHPDRAVHDAVLRTYHPELARAPLVRPDGSFQPLVPGLRWTASVIARRARVRLGLEADGPQFERRRYRRIYDLDNAGWRDVRAMAEEHRPLLFDWFDEAELLEYVPEASQPLELSSPIDEGYGRKSMLALMLWRGSS